MSALAWSENDEARVGMSCNKIAKAMNHNSGANVIAPPFHHVNFANPTEPNRQEVALTFFGHKLNDVGCAPNSNPTTPCANSCKKVAGKVSKDQSLTNRLKEWSTSQNPMTKIPITHTGTCTTSNDLRRSNSVSKLSFHTYSGLSRQPVSP
jgi:hypothetical protein